MKKYLVLFVALFAVIVAKAVPAIPEPMSVTQPDGTTLQVSLHGDEMAHYTTTSDGYLVAESASGFQYATFAANDALQLSGVVAHNAEQRSAAEQQFVASLQRVEQMPAAVQRQHARQRALHQQAHAKSYPLKGSPHSLVILVEFSDLKFTLSDPQAKFTALLNESGYSQNGGTGSARDYFIAASDSAFSPIFDVYGPYTLPETMEYYGGNSSTRTDVNASIMITQAVEKACDAGVDMSLYDTDNNGVIDNVFVYYAGHNEAEFGGEKTVWPHRSKVWGSAEYCGKTVYDYACTSELRLSSGSNMCGIGTFVHEFGHVLGLPDMYNTEDGDAYTVGSWDVMCSGSYNNSSRTPPTYSSYERFFLGWLTPTQLENPGLHMLEPLTTSNQAYLVAATTHNLNGASPSPREFFMIENRQHVGWDAPEKSLPGVGMLVTHINYDAGSWDNNKPNNDPSNLRIDIVEAYNSKPTSSSASDTYPGTRGVMIFRPILHDGTDIEQPLLNIRETGNVVSFVYISDSVSSFTFEPSSVDLLNSSYDSEKRRTISAEIDSVRIKGKGLVPSDNVTITTKSDFELSFDAEVWSGSLTDTVLSDSTFNRLIYLRYYPNAQVCDVEVSFVTITSSTSMAMLGVTGTSPRPTYVVTPAMDEASDVTPYSFMAHWDAVDDAEAYYITVYRKVQESSEVMQSFEDFGDKSAVAESGWSSNFNSTTTSVKSQGSRALLFQSTGDTLVTQDYVSPVSEFSFWVCGNYTNNDDPEIGGRLKVHISADGVAWTVIDSIEVGKTTKATKTFAPDTTYTRIMLTYTHKGGKGGAAIDAFTAKCNEKIIYLHQGRELTILGNAESMAYISDLQPNTEYYCQVQCTDLDKGCEEHLTELSEPLLIKTLDGTSSSGSKLTVAYENGEYVVYVPQADMDRYIFVYDVRGILIEKIAIESTLENRIVLPRLLPNNFYVLKYSEEGRHKRKDKWAKLFYQEF